jgi:hypothetical protein
MINYITNLLFARRKYIENVRDAIAGYEYSQTSDNLNKICLETHKLARFYNDIYWPKHEYVLGQYIWKLQQLEGAELTLAIYDYQLWLNGLVRWKWLSSIVEEKFRKSVRR